MTRSPPKFLGKIWITPETKRDLKVLKWAYFPKYRSLDQLMKDLVVHFLEHENEANLPILAKALRDFLRQGGNKSKIDAPQG